MYQKDNNPYYQTEHKGKQIDIDLANACTYIYKDAGGEYHYKATATRPGYFGFVKTYIQIEKGTGIIRRAPVTPV